MAALSQRLWVTGLAAALGTALPHAAAAQCPPGDWFCDEEAPPELAPEPDQDAEEQEEEGPSRSVEPPPPGMHPPRMDVTAPHPDDELEPEDFSVRPMSPWSVALRLQGVTLGSSGNGAAMGGVGASLRYAFNPYLQLDVGFDSFGGTDYSGYDRTESSLATSLLVYLNPRGVVRTYTLAGLHLSAARVDVYGDRQDWTYVGGHGGLGLDIPIHERVSLTIDLLGFLRGRTDARAAREPEFTDDSGNLTNTSGGGLFRGGVALAW